MDISYLKQELEKAIVRDLETFKVAELHLNYNRLKLEVLTLMESIVWVYDDSDFEYFTTKVKVIGLVKHNPIYSNYDLGDICVWDVNSYNIVKKGIERYKSFNIKDGKTFKESNKLIRMAKELDSLKEQYRKVALGY